VTIAVATELDRFYALLQSRWSVVDGSDYAGLVVPNGNGGAPVHRWFRMKEAYSCELLDRVLTASGLDARRALSVCDPFCGSGTTGVSLAHAVAAGKLHSAQFTGLEINPYLHLVAKTKLAAMCSPPAEFPALAQRVGAAVAQRGVEPAPVPKLSTFADRRYFDDATLSELLQLRTAITTERERGADPLALDLATVCLGSIVEPVSKLRRDGRALRHEPEKSTPRPLAAFLERASEIEDDLPALAIPLAASLHRADARDGGAILQASDPFDLVVFSPPYPNNIDYTEVYKLEGWLLGFYADDAEFKAQRWRTLRSHASLDFGEEPTGRDDTDWQEVQELIVPLLEAVPEDRYTAARRRTIRGYAYDMLGVLRHLRSAMAEDGQLIYVVGNSLHGGRDGTGLLIAADLLIARLAELAGFAVTRLAVARVPSRRRTASPYLRESVVFADAHGAAPMPAKGRKQGGSRD
jgi:hypothetical protein